MKPRRRERGYASVTAIAAVAVLAMFAVTMIETNRTGIGDLSAEVEQARVSAAADAGLAMALDGLLVKDRGGRWSIDGRTRSAEFAGSRLKIRIEDERGKVPLNLLDDEYAERLVEVAGLANSPRGTIAAQSLVDWLDGDDEPHPEGAESEWYRARGIHPRNAPLQSIDELAQIRGWDRALVEKVRPFVTVNFGAGGFDARYAQPKAIGVMTAGGADSPEAIQRQRELSGQRVAIEIGEAVDLVGRPLSIIVEAQRPSGARVERRSIIELTGSPERPYLVRSYQ